MDIFDVQLQKAPMRKQQELALLSSRTGNRGGHAKRGAATWITSSITIEELQISLLIDIRRLGKHSTKMQRLEILLIFREDFGLDDNIRDLEVEFIDDSEGEGDMFTESDHDSNHVPQCNFFHPEKVVIPLPLNIGIKRCTELGVIHLVGQEVALWEGQANDTLQAIQVLLADKAVLFCTTVHPAKSQAKSTRAWTQVHSVERVIKRQTMIYSKCRAQLGNLQAHNLLEKYLRMERSHLKATAAVASPNAWGQRNTMLPWFWSLDVQGDSGTVYRVHWLRTKALRDRWSEELLLVDHEMGWTVQFFLHKACSWLSCITHNGDPLPEGHKCYAIQQAHMYHELAEHACASFLKANPKFTINA
ncbi:uncharacterized protein F5891DRAFT_1195384 [Suillus fuscotomentosus]|uniref:Uncharacterized protein n=1 Tax=Suillus fuscotomentosus TaxID=1912939 RepID=A0AAD4HFG3_9AGAM|nr:uncharacterized protein F5891DRAFT_1195384 [Suillus fuscotomentosus]KAG1894251.1 hypothetical protein F5891DRAFT_1195384 [Suillus fuscotomentosus]